jgi:hypothetical protein
MVTLLACVGSLGAYWAREVLLCEGMPGVIPVEGLSKAVFCLGAEGGLFCKQPKSRVNSNKIKAEFNNFFINRTLLK